jgi:hypothetical protein
MKLTNISFGTARWLLAGSMLLVPATLAFGQVSPTEVQNSTAKAEEQRYFSQLVSLQKAIGATNFPFTFRLARYLDAKPGQRAALDSNGIEFVYFQNRVVLKISGFYRVAFNSMQLSVNGRARQTLQEAVLPILRLVEQELPQSVECDAIGFEILYNTRDTSSAYDFEGQEVLTVVINRDDAFKLAEAATNSERQEILDRSDVFVNSKTLELALGQSDTPELHATQLPVGRPAMERASFKPVKPARATVNDLAVAPAVAGDQTVKASNSPSAALDAAGQQEKLQAEVNAIRQGSDTPVQSEDRAPSFETEGNQKLLHYNLRNTLSFERNDSSIYKRAAQSFDLFLAPELKGISKKLPADTAIDALHFSVVNRLSAQKNETIEYICPMDSMRSFVENKITTQDLINKSTVLVNGVRIGLDLERVE